MPHATTLIVDSCTMWTPESKEVQGVRHSGELECASVKYSEARSPEVTWPADITSDDVDTWDVCHMSVS
jgi:hypothetical protein